MKEERSFKVEVVTDKNDRKSGRALYYADGVNY